MSEPEEPYWCEDCETWVDAWHAWSAGYGPQEGDEARFAEWTRQLHDKLRHEREERDR